VATGGGIQDLGSWASGLTSTAMAVLLVVLGGLVAFVVTGFADVGGPGGLRHRRRTPALKPAEHAR